MTEEKEELNVPISVFICGPEMCEHKWDGPVEEYETMGAFVSTSTCSKCGMPRIDHDMWVGP